MKRTAQANRPLRALLLGALLIGAAGLAGFGCKKSAPKATSSAYPSDVTLTGATMGTRYNIKVRVQSADQAASAAALTARVDARLADINKMMSTYDPESELSRFNAAPGGQPFEVSRETADVVKLALDVAHKTDGALDVTLGPLIKLWGFDGDKIKARPGDAELKKAKARVGYRKLHIDGKERLLKEADGMYVILSAVAKGWACDQVSDLVLAAGFGHHMVEIGGEVRARGLNKKDQPWTIGINVPTADADARAVLRAVPLKDLGLATSGNYRNFFESGGKRYGHILDARTGEPDGGEAPTIVSVSKLAPATALADALATAGMVMGEKRTREILDKHFVGVEALFVSQGPDGMKVSSTEGFPKDPHASGAATR